MLNLSPFSRGFLRMVALATLLTGVCLPAFSQSTRVRVVSANLTSGNGQSYDTPGLDILAGLKPDVVAIQEFNYANNTAADFRAMIDSTFGTNFVYYRENGGYQIPNGIISRYPIIQSGDWTDPVLSNRGFAWARIALPGSNELYVVSVHLYSGGSAADRTTEATTIKNNIQSLFPANAWVIVAGDFNTQSRTEPALLTFGTFLSDNPQPADNNGDKDTNANRNSPYDYVLPSFSMTNVQTAVVLPSHSFPNGLVFDSRVYTPLTDVPPVVAGDSGAANMQHMAVVKDFLVPGTNSAFVPYFNLQPSDRTVGVGDPVQLISGASGTPNPSYQWYFNGTAVPGAIGNALTVTNAQLSNNGNYFVTASNSAGIATSSIAVLTVTSTAPAIVTQPQNQTVPLGSSASFSVVASGPSLFYQWRFNGDDIGGATASSLSLSNIQNSDVGSYLVVITNTQGSITSAPATLTIGSSSGPQSVIVQWNFDTTNAATLASPLPSTGSGTLVAIGNTTPAWVSGTSSTDTNNPNNAWNTANYPAQGALNKQAGAQFSVSTVGKQNIVIRWDQRNSATASKYARLQYSINGSTFVDYPSAISITNAGVFESKTNSLVAMLGANNNPDFKFRIVSEFDGTANNNGNPAYVAVSGNYGTAGTMRFDMVTVLGNDIVSILPPTPAVLGAPVFDSNAHQFQFSVSGATGSNYVVQASDDLSSATWTNLLTNAAPFTFTETNAANFPGRFYRAIAQ